MKLESFDYNGVSLKAGLHKKQFNLIKDFYYNLSNDVLLYNFRKRAGMKAPSNSLGGWCSMDFCDILGQLLSAFSKMYCITKEKNILEKINYLMYEWADTIEKDGFFLYTNNPSVPHYIYDKMVGGLVDICKYTGNKDSLKYLGKITDWAEKNLDKTNEYAHNGIVGATEWFTLPENLYRAFVLTGQERYKNLGDSFLYNDYYKYYFNNDFNALMEAGLNSKYRRHHTYSHINTLGSAAMAYYVTRDDFYLKTIKNSYEILKDTQLFNTGGYGPCETFVWPEQRIETLYAEDFHFEVACGSWAVFKLVRYLIEFTGLASYGDWSEKIIYNGIGAALPVEDNGNVMYYANYNINGATKETCNPWSCCTGTFPIDVAEYHNQIYYKSRNGIYINLFIPSAAEFKINNVNVAIHQSTEFPKNNISSITVKIDNPIEFELGIRIPGWLSGELKIKIGNRYADYVKQDNWAKVKKLWKNNDTVEIYIPAKIQARSLCNSIEYPKAIEYGPIVMVAQSEDKPNIIKNDLENIGEEAIITKNDNFSFVYKLHSGKNLVLKPFYDIPKEEKYYMYFDPVPSDRIDHRNVKYGLDLTFWKEAILGHPVMVLGNNLEQEFEAQSFKGMAGISEKLIGHKAHISTKPGAFFESGFNGKGIRWVGSQIPDGGFADIYIDSNFIETVNQFGLVRGVPWMWEKKDLKYGKHNFKVVSKEEKDIDSSGYIINLKHLTVL